MAALINTKKGLFFTLTAILIITVLVLGSSTRNSYSPVHDIPVVETRVQVADDYVHNLNDFYLERALFVSSYWALEAIAVYQGQNGFFDSRSEFNEAFAEVMVKGTIDGASIDSLTGKTIMEENTLLHRLGQIEQASMDAHNIKTQFAKAPESFNVYIHQSENESGPWSVTVNATFTYNVDAGLARWDYTTLEESKFEIYGLSDPFIMVKSSGTVSRKIEEARPTEWNTATFSQHILDGTYRADPNGVSFLDRFHNNLSKSECCGIESVLNPNAMGLSDTDKSYVDYCFYTTRCPPDTEGQLWYITGITSSVPSQNFYALKLDDYHVVVYKQEAYPIPP